MLESTCENCEFSALTKDPNEIGVEKLMCHRYPPTPIAVPTGPGQMGIMTIYPPVHPQATCGEWEPDGRLTDDPQLVYAPDET